MFWLFVFTISCLVLFWSGSRLVRSLVRVARYLGWREFIVAFFIVAFAASLPNLFVGINSALHKIPELALGDIVGQNMIDLTFAVGLAVLIGGNALQVRSKMVQTSTIFTALIAVLPLILILDRNLGRIDGIILLLVFGLYIFWLFSKEERFRKVYKINKTKPAPAPRFIEFLRYKKEPKTIRQFKAFFKDLLGVAFALFLLLAASYGIVQSARAFSNLLNLTLPVVGILIVSLGTALPETYFAVVSARKGQTWLVLGDLMGAVIVTSTLVLGITVLICPIENIDFSPFAIARIFLVISALFFWFAVSTNQKVTKKEGLFLLLIYIAFIAAEIIFH